MNAATGIHVEQLVVAYGSRRGELRAVDGITFHIDQGGSLGVIGESGSGKSSLALAIAGLTPIRSGRIQRTSPPQMIFQDPLLALNPRRKAWQSVAEPLDPKANRLSNKLRAPAIELLERVGLGASFADRTPRQLSGGQRQRVTIARALASQTQIILCDEPVASLDVSLQAGVLQLLDDLRRERQLTYLLISHELRSVRVLTQRVAVMYLGQFVETGPTAEVLDQPRHPYTQALVSSAPVIGRPMPDQAPVQGEVPDPRHPPTGCRFRTRCPYATDLCAHEMPRLENDGAGRSVACHYWRQIRAGQMTREVPGTPPPPASRKRRRVPASAER